MTALLLGIVVAGTLINGVMVFLTVYRWRNFRPGYLYKTDDKHAQLKFEIGTLTLRRALRLEFSFFVCQLVRLVHCVYTIFYLHDQFDFWASLERSFVTFILIYLSVADLITRNILVPKLNELHPDPEFPTTL